MRVRSAVLDAIAAHARRESPRECCGLLIGTEHEVIEAVATANVAADPLRHYQVSPVDHFGQIRRCRESTSQGVAAVDVIGAYHSHPRSVPTPSPTDLEEAFEDFLFIIAGPVDDSAPLEVRAYRLQAGKFEGVQLDAIPDAEEA
ncbi:MAG: peptidase [Acidobacteria bacterium]|nr:peptidase [Acidobacteriota bacterium]